MNWRETKMITYKDKCFCSNKECSKANCDRNYQKAVKERAEAEVKYGFQFPIAVSDYDCICN